MAFLVIQEPGKDQFRFPVDQSRTRMGRSDRNELCLASDASVSRYHAELIKEDEQFLVRDLGSRHGTRVNGVAIHEPAVLRPGDRIHLGHTLLVFETSEGSRLSDFPDATEELDHMHTIQLPLSEVLSTTLEERIPSGEGSAAAPQSRAFAILSQATEQLVAQRPLEEVIELVMDLAFKATYPDRAVLMLLEGDPPRLHSRSERSAEPDAAAMQISRTIAGMAINDGQAVLMSDAGVDQRFAEAESIVIQQIRSAMCVPLWDNRGVIGLVYVDRSRHASSYSKEDLELLSLLANVGAVKIENCRLFLRDQQMRTMEQELATAARIQRQLLSATPPQLPGFEMTGCNVQCREVGGDYFDFQTRESGHVALAIGDVSGKGIGAALLTGAVQATFRAHLSTVAELARVVAKTNEAVLTSSADDQFVTFFCAELDPGAARLRYVNAGHNPPLLLRADGSVEELNRTGMVLGVMPDLSYGQEECSLEPGDLLILYSDGLTESFNPAGEEFEPERLARTVQAFRQKPLQEIQQLVFQEIAAFAGPQAQPFDDMTLMLLRRN